MLTAAKREGTVLRVEGTFDALAAARLQFEIALSRARIICLDLSGVTGFNDTSLAFLADILRYTRRTVRVLGLNRHHEHGLKLLGMELDGAGHIARTRAKR
jgi:anti-anti-sigma regulatory factor